MTGSILCNKDKHGLRDTRNIKRKMANAHCKSQGNTEDEGKEEGRILELALSLSSGSHTLAMMTGPDLGGGRYGPYISVGGV